MEIDATIFWRNFDQLLKSRSITLLKLCECASLSYGTITQNKHRNVFPLVTNLVAIASVLGVSLDELVFGDADQRLPVAVKAVMQNTRLQTIVAALLASPDKLSAIETLLGVKQVPPNVKSLA